MLENLFDLVKQHAGNAIINNPAIPNEQNNDAIEVASSSIFDGLKNAATSGNLQDIIGMFSGGSTNAIGSGIQDGMIQNMMATFGINTAQAGGIASSLIPTVLQSLVSKTNDPNDSSFNLQSIISSVAGGSGGGFDVQSLISQFTDGNKQENADNNGGMLNNLKGLFGI